MAFLNRGWIAFASVNGAVAVGAGAYARHGLVGDSHAQELFQLAGEYQLWHALALLALALLARQSSGVARWLARLAGWLFVAGILLFCGTLYATALSIDLPIGMTAPLGGSAFIIGWLVLAGSALVGRWAD
jgi:uncharacterized membrane protein YgdD (TMEM256/DUF423 family)